MISFKVSNFRVFGKDGVKLDFSPVTILTGANSSGKSSYVKALVLFQEWMDGIRNEYRKDGTFNPAAHALDFSRADLKLRGFSGTVNRNAGDDARMVFSLDVDLGVILGKYTVEYAFVAGATSSGLDAGILDSIRILSSDDVVFRAERHDEKLKTVFFDVRSCFAYNFMMLESFVLIPAKMASRYKDVEDGTYYLNVCDDAGSLSYEKLAETPEGQDLYELQSHLAQGLDSAIFGWMDCPLPNKDSKTYNTLFSGDNFHLVAKSVEEDMFFYFPVLEYFKGASKNECVEILLNKAHPCVTLKNMWGGSSFKIDEVVKAFKASDKDSFIDFYHDLEGECLGSFDHEWMDIQTIGKSYDFVKTGIIQGLEITYGTNRFYSAGLFGTVYDVLSCWQWAEDEESDDSWKAENAGRERPSLYDEDSAYLHRYACEYPEYYGSEHKLYEAFLEYVEYVLKMLLMPDTFSRMNYFNGSFATVQRLHSFEENSLLVRTVRQYLEGKRVLDSMNKSRFGRTERNTYVPGTFMEKWLKELNIGNRLQILMDDEGLGFKLYMEKDGGRESLADLGHGMTQMVSLLLLVESAIIEGRILRNSLIERWRGNQDYESVPDAILAIEEPEVSLHPNYQSMLTAMFEDATSNYGTKIVFLIETHSEYMVRKTQAIVSGFNEEQFKKNPFSVYYFTEDGDAYSMGYTVSGRFERSFGEGFFDESARLNYQVIKREKEQAGK